MSNVDWERIDMERRIEDAREDAYHETKRVREQMRENLAAAREDADSLAARIDELEAQVAKLQETVQILADQAGIA